jgi:hypothetical protein
MTKGFKGRTLQYGDLDSQPVVAELFARFLDEWVYDYVDSLVLGWFNKLDTHFEVQRIAFIRFDSDACPPPVYLPKAASATFSITPNISTEYEEDHGKLLIRVRCTTAHRNAFNLARNVFRTKSPVSATSGDWTGAVFHRHFVLGSVWKALNGIISVYVGDAGISFFAWGSRGCNACLLPCRQPDSGRHLW